MTKVLTIGRAFVVGALFISIYSSAQKPDLPIRIYDMRDGLSQMKTTSIAQDSLGYIWIGTRNGLNRFDGKTMTNFYEEDGLLHNRIHDIEVDSLGRIWILSFKGLSVYNGRTFNHFPYDFLEAEYSIAIDPSGHVVVYRNIQIWVLEKDSIRALPKDFKGVIIDSKTRNVYTYTTDAVKDLQGRHLITIPDGPFLEYSNVFGTKTREQYKSGQSNQAYYIENGRLLSEDNVDDIIRKNGESGYKYWNNQLILFHNGLLDTLTSNPLNRISDQCLDNEGHMWLSAENGFAQIQQSPFYHIPFQKVPYVWTVNEDNNGNVIAGTYGYGIYQSQDSKTFKRMNLNPRMSHFHASSVKDTFGHIYLSSVGIWKYTKDGFSKISGQTSFALSYDPHAHVLYSGGLGGIEKISLSTGEKEVFGFEGGLHKNDYIQSLAIDREGYLWAGSYSGVSRISPDFKTCVNYTQALNNLPSKGIYSILNDDNGRLWLGGDEQLLTYDFARDSILIIETQILSSVVKSLLDIDGEMLLIGAKDGLYLLDLLQFNEDNIVDLKFVNRSNGYLGLEPGFTGMFQDSKGYVWITSATSLDRLDLSKFSQSHPKVLARMSKINDFHISYDNNEDIQIPKGTDNISVTVDVIGTVRQDQTGYEYQFDDGPWSSLSHDPNLVFNSLHSGTHKLSVRPAPSDQASTKMPTDEITFNISLPFYRHHYFPTIVLSLLSLLLLWALYLYWRQRIENQKYAKQLAASKYLQSRLLLSELNPHFIFNVLSSIQRKVLLGDRDEASQYLVKLSKMIRNFLSASHQSHTSTSEFKSNNIPLSQELDLLQSYMDFERMKSNNHFEFQFDIEPGLDPDIYFIPPMIAQPFVENSIKHGLLLQDSPGMLNINITSTERGLHIIIEDNGVGRQRAKEIKGDRSGHVSLGTIIIDERIDLLNQLGHDIEIITEDVEPQGTRVHLYINE